MHSASEMLPIFGIFVMLVSLWRGPIHEADLAKINRRNPWVAVFHVGSAVLIAGALTTLNIQAFGH